MLCLQISDTLAHNFKASKSLRSMAGIQSMDNAGHNLAQKPRFFWVRVNVFVKDFLVPPSSD